MSSRRLYVGPIVLSGGFRPFFLAAASWAALVMPVWLAMLNGYDLQADAKPALTWHIHELVFGYSAAVVAGFLLTAVPNWTGRLPIKGRPLLALLLLWIAGRLGMALSGQIGVPTAAVLDLLFPTVFAGLILREIIAGKNWRNLPVAIVLLLLLTGNMLVHADALGWVNAAAAGGRLGLAVLLMLIALIGGRITPSFTRNWLVKNQPGVAEPAPFGRLDQAALAATAVALALWVAAPESGVSAGLALLAGTLLAARLARWRGLATTAEPLLLILHVGYSWLPIGLILLGLARWLEVLPAPTALHALTAGAIGTMTLAVMTRVALGHSGQPLHADRTITAIYLLITLSVLARLAAGLFGSVQSGLISLAGLGWTAAFILFLWRYVPLLALDRKKGRSNAK